MRADFILENPDAVEVFVDDGDLEDDDDGGDDDGGDQEDEDGDPEAESGGGGDEGRAADRGAQLWFGEAPAAPQVRPLTG
jgi:hypothetical protein